MVLVVYLVGAWLGGQDAIAEVTRLRRQETGQAIVDCVFLGIMDPSTALILNNNVYTRSCYPRISLKSENSGKCEIKQ